VTNTPWPVFRELIRHILFMMLACLIRLPTSCFGSRAWPGTRGSAVKLDIAFVQSLYRGLEEGARQGVDRTVQAVVAARRAGRKVAVVTGSGPNLHEGVTTLIAELIRAGIVQG
jgi:hypothetical protein